jgi:hypothetical protein
MGHGTCEAGCAQRSLTVQALSERLGVGMRQPIKQEREPDRPDRLQEGLAASALGREYGADDQRAVDDARRVLIRQGPVDRPTGVVPPASRCGLRRDQGIIDPRQTDAPLRRGAPPDRRPAALGAKRDPSDAQRKSMRKKSRYLRTFYLFSRWLWVHHVWQRDRLLRRCSCVFSVPTQRGMPTVPIASLPTQGFVRAHCLSVRACRQSSTKSASCEFTDLAAEEVPR